MRLWDVETGELKGVLTGHTKKVTSVAFSPDGVTLASASVDGTVRLWHTETGELKGVLTGDEYRGGSVVFSPDGGTLASTSLKKTVLLWDVETGELKGVLTGHKYGGVKRIAFRPDGRRLPLRVGTRRCGCGMRRRVN